MLNQPCSDLFLRQLFDRVSCTYTYLLADPETLEGAIIDPVKEYVDRYLNLIKELGIDLRYILETHIHADHVTGAWPIKLATGAQIALGEAAQAENADIRLKAGQELALGQRTIKVLKTDGHTDCSVTYRLKGKVFTGDSLLIRSCGRTDFQNGSAEKLYESVHRQLFTLADETLVYPGHDYNGMLLSTIGEEKRHNPRLNTTNSRENVISIMSKLDLAPPDKLAIAVPANRRCGKSVA